MKDFFKIFGVLSLVVASFMFGRNHGEQKFQESEAYQSLLKGRTAAEFANNDVANARTKLQNILNTAETQKTEELLAQILNVFLVDLGLRIQNQEAFLKIKEQKAEETKAPPEVAIEKPKPARLPAERDEKKLETYLANQKKMKSFEWMLVNAQSSKEVKSILKNVEIKDLSSALKASKPGELSQFQSIFGSYRGRLMAIDGAPFSTLIFDITGNQEKANVKIQTIQNGRKNVHHSETDKLGFVMPESSGLILNLGSASSFYQVYKTETNQLAGYFYERLQNGTTKTIGSFVLNRVDQF